MPERVTVHLGGNAVTEGYYTVDGNDLTMTYSNGNPVEIDGQVQRWQLQPGQKPHQVAGYLTRQIRRTLSGQTETEEAFNRPIGYLQAGVA